MHASAIPRYWCDANASFRDSREKEFDPQKEHHLLAMRFLQKAQRFLGIPRKCSTFYRRRKFLKGAEKKNIYIYLILVYILQYNIVITSAMQSINGASLKEHWAAQHC